MPLELPYSSPAAPAPATRVRWLICALLFFATTINYMDRQIIGVLKPLLEQKLHWDEIDFGNIIFAFQAAYAIGYLGAGRLIDRLGVRTGYALIVVAWSFAAMSHALAGALVGFTLARIALGLAEGGNFPAAVKSVGEWFPKKERALAAGIFNSGSNVGVIASSLFAPLIAATLGWPYAFLAIGTLGLIWVLCWAKFYHTPDLHPAVNAAERALIHADDDLAPAAPVPWLQLLTYRQTWSYAAGMFLTAPVWWFYLFWIPDFLHKKSHSVNLLEFGLPLVTIYLISDVGSVAGGWLSSHLIRRGWSVNAARKTAMLACALCALPIAAAALVSNLWLAVILVGLAAAAHQGFSCNLYTLVSDTVPKQATSSVVGIGGTLGAIGGMISATIAGHVLQWTGQYFILFLGASVAYFFALAAIHVLNPRLEPMKLSPASGFPIIINEGNP